MTMEIKQWIGRGIRRESDYALIAVYDPRFLQSGVFRALPDGVEITDSLDRVRDFFAKHRSGQ
jgi:Rad3-related DNA helicase